MYNQKNLEKVKLNTCFIIYIKTDDIYKDIAEDVETRFDTSNYELDRKSPKGKNKRVIRLMKDEFGGNIMTKYVGFLICMLQSVGFKVR